MTIRTLSRLAPRTMATATLAPVFVIGLAAAPALFAVPAGARDAAPSGTASSEIAGSAERPTYFDATPGLTFKRDDRGVLTVTFGEDVDGDGDGDPLTFTAQHHEDLVRAFYEIGQDRKNAVVILAGAAPESASGQNGTPGSAPSDAAGGTIADIDFASFGNVGDPDVWSKVHDEGVQVLENLINIRVPVIAALEGATNVHSEYFLTANLIVAGEGATFNDLPHFAGGIVPGDGIFQTWSYLAGPGRAQAFLLDPQPVSAQTANDWGVVSHVVPDGTALERATELAHAMVEGRPALTLRNTRLHFAQPLKERLVDEVSNGLALEGATAAALVKQLNAASPAEDDSGTADATN